MEKRNVAAKASKKASKSDRFFEKMEHGLHIFILLYAVFCMVWLIVTLLTGKYGEAPGALLFLAIAVSLFPESAILNKFKLPVAMEKDSRTDLDARTYQNVDLVNSSLFLVILIMQIFKASFPGWMIIRCTLLTYLIIVKVIRLAVCARTAHRIGKIQKA